MPLAPSDLIDGQKMALTAKQLRKLKSEPRKLALSSPLAPRDHAIDGVRIQRKQISRRFSCRLTKNQNSVAGTGRVSSSFMAAAAAFVQRCSSSAGVALFLGQVRQVARGGDDLWTVANNTATRARDEAAHSRRINLHRLQSGQFARKSSDFSASAAVRRPLQLVGQKRNDLCELFRIPSRPARKVAAVAAAASPRRAETLRLLRNQLERSTCCCCW